MSLYGALTRLNIPLNSELPQASSVVSRWDLTEDGGTRYDRKDTNHLTDNNTVLSANGYINATSDRGFQKAADFERGNTEYLSITDAAQTGLDITGALTISAWIKLESNGFYQTIAGKYTAGTGTRSYTLQVYDTNKLNIAVSSDGSVGTQVVFQGDTSITTGVWYHVVCVYEPSTRMELYIDGVSDGTKTTGVPASVHNSASPFEIGRADTGLDFDGLIQDVIIWSAALTDTQVTALYESYTTSSGSGLTANTGAEITTTTTVGDDKVCGVVASSTIADDAYGTIVNEGKITTLKVDGTTDIAIGNYLCAYSTAGIAQKAAAGDMAFAIALEAYTTNDSSGVIDALLIKPRKL